jgi:hypothetical protein
MRYFEYLGNALGQCLYILTTKCGHIVLVNLLTLEYRTFLRHKFGIPSLNNICEATIKRWRIFIILYKEVDMSNLY